MDEMGSGPSGVRLLGDVVISLDTAARQARSRRRPLIDEVIHLLSHGLLHLVGYDHRTDSEERRMNAAAAELLVGSSTRAPRPRILSAPPAKSALTSRPR
jgi:probable rRNA maturation factor